MLEQINHILDFWFGKSESELSDKMQLWWQKDKKFDQTIAENFETLLNQAIKGELDAWIDHPKSCLAYIILLDQFSRNIYRDTPKAFEQDPLALKACIAGIEHKLDKDLNFFERQFFYMPLEHTEDLGFQTQSVALFKQLLEDVEREKPEYSEIFKSAYDYALQHRSIIETFGRFPHRNEALNRITTIDEAAFLKQPNSSF